MSAMKVVPFQPLVISAVIITIPGVRNAMYDESLKPGRFTTPLNSWPNSSNQMAGCTSVKAISAGDRYCARSHRPVDENRCASRPPGRAAEVVVETAVIVAIRRPSLLHGSRRT